MKSKSGGGLFGIFKKKTTPAPAAPTPTAIPDDSKNSGANNSIDTTTTVNNTPMPPRKGSIAQTSVIHYSPPGTVRIPSVAPSTVGSDGGEDQVVITRKSNIVLDDEESVISTPVSQYDESPIIHKPRKKRQAAPPPPPLSPAPTFSNQHPQAQQPHPHHRQFSTSSLSPITTSSSSDGSTPPPLPPHGSSSSKDIDYEEMLKRIQVKFAEWNRIRAEDAGSMNEEKIKAEVLKQHEELRKLLEQEIGDSKGQTLERNNNAPKSSKKHQPPAPKIPQYGNFYPSPAQTRKVPGGTVYQKTSTTPEAPRASQLSQKPQKEQKVSPTIVAVTSPKPQRSKIDENRNEIQIQYQKTSTHNTAAVDRLRKEVEEQRQREKEIKQYRNPKEAARPESPRKEGPRMVEYKPMKSPGLPQVEDVAPPIPKTPPPKLAEYRKEQNPPRMPQVPTNGYVRLQMGGKKTSTAPQAPAGPPTSSISPKPAYKAPEYASSPKLLRKVAESPKVQKKIYEDPPPQLTTSSPKLIRKVAESPKPQKRIYEAPQLATTKPATSPTGYQKGMISTIIAGAAAASNQKTSNYQKISPAKKPEDYRVISKPVVQKPTTMTNPEYIRIPPVSATSPPYQKGSTMIQVRPTALPVAPPAPPAPSQPMNIPRPPVTPKNNPTEGFAISDVLKGPRLRKVGMPVEKSGILMGKVLDVAPESTPSRPTSVPPPPPPPPPMMSTTPSSPQKNPDLRDSLMSEIREAGRLRAARAAQSA